MQALRLGSARSHAGLTIRRCREYLTDLATALEQNAAVNERLITRLDGIDSRLGSVEKTLNDIPG